MNIHAKEAEFHDAWAHGEDPNEVRVREAFDGPTALENRFILGQMGPLAGKRLLDVGAGLGESSVYFALQGAKVTMMDLSPAMVEFGLRLAHRFAVEIEGRVAAADDFQLGGREFDIVYAANVIHHVTDKEAFWGEIHRALRPGGRFFTFDPLRYNPVLSVYRGMATQVRTADERPLGFESLDIARRFFPRVRHREFWILTLTLFLMYYLIDGVHPNQDRYWKRILKETTASLWWWHPLRWTDEVLTRLPLIRRLAWNMVIWGEKNG